MVLYYQSKLVNPFYQHQHYSGNPSFILLYCHSFHFLFSISAHHMIAFGTIVNHLTRYLVFWRSPPLMPLIPHEWVAMLNEYLMTVGWLAFVFSLLFSLPPTIDWNVRYWINVPIWWLKFVPSMFEPDDNWSDEWTPPILEIIINPSNGITPAVPMPRIMEYPPLPKLCLVQPSLN